MQNYRIGVLLSAYNGDKYIAQQIESIMKQKNRDHITLLVRNDGSTDKTSEILEKLKNKYNNLRVISGPNIGLISSFFELLKIGITEYNFDYYSFCDQDDYWLEDKLQVAVNYLEKESRDVPVLYGCRSLIVDDSLEKTGFITQAQKRKLTFYNTAIQNIVIGHNQVLNKKLAEIIVTHTLRLDNIYSQDLWVTNVAAVCGKILFDNTPHTLYRMHGYNQLGYGKGKLDRVRGHLVRLQKKEPQKMAKQLKCFVEYYKKFISDEEKKEIKMFLVSQDNFKNRFMYVRKTKLYRQTKKETLQFKILYVLGAYNFS
ncbi:glycosyl transferase, family 2 [Lactobacillus amylovorus GRL1118]|uniref:glycosyltransferase n=1 Tax=Lactobacillus amylovorus TaxID=1604 RepID=UPI0002016142|nr:glycosyltransferase [Lactobacillus amylovorus]AEA32647.1 glycosyl transferase, family 2 [Lactobacillus amylovorus GRL1118]